MSNSTYLSGGDPPPIQNQVIRWKPPICHNSAATNAYNPLHSTNGFSYYSGMELTAMCDHNDLSSAERISVATGPRRVVYLLAAGGFFALGVAGILLPGLPTTPFLLLTSYFLLRSSPSLNERLTHSRFLGPILQDWHARRGVRQSVKLRAIALVVLMLAVSIYLGNMPAPLATTVLALGGVGLTVIALLPSISTTNNHAAVKTAAFTDPVD